MRRNAKCALVVCWTNAMDKLISGTTILLGTISYCIGCRETWVIRPIIFANDAVNPWLNKMDIIGEPYIDGSEDLQ